MNRQVNIILTSVCLLAFMFSSATFAQDQVTIETGKFSFNEKMPGYRLSKGKIGDKPSGERKFTKKVQFSEKFDKEPSVALSILGIDTRTTDRNLRYRIEAKYVSREGFVIEVTTWYDSEIIAIQGNWIAISN